MKLPTFEELGKEIIGSVAARTDSLDMLEVVQALTAAEKTTMPAPEMEELFNKKLDDIAALPDDQRNTALLIMGLRAGMIFRVTIGGKLVDICPVEEERATEPPQLPPDGGDREPRSPIIPPQADGVKLEPII